MYRARNVKLHREVALKVVPEAFALNANRLMRFTREARVLASLNHPNIAAIYGLEDDAGSVRALALELVEGETLADRIARGPIAVGEALRIAYQIAEALEAAHGLGVIHRDLKPANVVVRADDKFKVLDFGLAKVYTGDAITGGQPTITAAATRENTVLGTAAYMSPEQAHGAEVDTRTDIWAFGCVLFEMLTGRRAFAGETIADTLAAVVFQEPLWTSLPSATSAHPAPPSRALSA